MKFSVVGYIVYFILFFIKYSREIEESMKNIEQPFDFHLPSKEVEQFIIFL